VCEPETINWSWLRVTVPAELPPSPQPIVAEITVALGHCESMVVTVPENAVPSTADIAADAADAVQHRTVTAATKAGRPPLVNTHPRTCFARGAASLSS
jgi:hypothetical protein